MIDINKEDWGLEARIITALALIATSGVGILSALAVYLPRRKREKLRRRGIKSGN